MQQTAREKTPILACRLCWPLPVALGGYQWVLIEIVTSLDWALYPVTMQMLKTLRKDFRRK